MIEPMGLEQQISRTRAVSILQKLPVFLGLHDDDYDQILTICQINNFNNGKVIFEEDDHSLKMYILLSGEVEISTIKDGVIYTMNPGDLFGEIGVICQVSRTASAMVKQDAVVLEIKKDDFDFLFGRCPSVVAKVLKNLSKILAERLLKSDMSAHVL